MIKNNLECPYIEDINFIIFGATGDLAQNKILPALFDLYCNNLLPVNFRINGFSRKDLSDEKYRDFVGKILLKNEKINSYPKKVLSNF